MNPHKGLTESEAQFLLKRHGYNELTAKKKNNSLKILFGIILEPVIAILIICSIIYFSFGTMMEAMLMGATVVLAITMSWIQEYKTEKALQALKDLSSPRTSVIRNGQSSIISSREIVPGDIILLHEGDRIPADGKILEANQFFADESIVTGESVAVEKENEDQIFSGTLAVKGEAEAIVTATGDLSTVGKIGHSLINIEEERTLLQKRMTKLGKSLSVIAFIISTLVFVLTLKTGKGWQDGLLASLATAIAMMPEEFPMVLTIYLALGSWRLSKISVLARKASAIENLGSISVLCVDKTGTLTLNEMNVAKTIGNENKIIEAASLASELHPTDPMERALLRKKEALKLASNNELKLITNFTVTKEFLAFRSLYQLSDQFLAFSKGAPETVMEQCQLSNEIKSQLKNDLDELARAGYRVLGVAEKPCQSETNWEEGQWNWLGLVAFLDPIREEVPSAVARCYDAGISLKMLTGDHPGTASTIAKMVGIQNPQSVIRGSELAELSQLEMNDKILSTNVYARVKPEQKLTLIQGLKAKGHHVAMTGDGVNDAPALKAANIGVAMGKRGADVAREAADIVLLDDNFASLVNAIEEGRRIYKNIQKSFSFLLGVHVIIGLLSFVPMLFGFPPILYPLHLVMMEFVIDPAASVVFAHELADPKLMKSPPRAVDEPLFSFNEFRQLLIRGFILTTIILIIFWQMLEAGVTHERSRLVAFLSLNFSVFFFLFRSIYSKPAKAWGYKILVFTLILFATILLIPPVREAFHMR